MKYWLFIVGFDGPNLGTSKIQPNLGNLRIKSRNMQWLIDIIYYNSLKLNLIKNS